MADIYIEKSHDFDFATAREKAKTWLNQAKNDYGLDIEYQENDHQDTVHINRAGIQGQATLTAEKIVFEANLAFIAKPLKGKITTVLTQGMEKYFA